MAKYKLLTGKHFKGGEIHQPGAVLELTDQEAEAFKDKFAPVQEVAVVLPPPQPDTGKGKTSKGKTKSETGDETGDETGGETGGKGS